MSTMHNGWLRTMKANYTIGYGHVTITCSRARVHLTVVGALSRCDVFFFSRDRGGHVFVGSRFRVVT